MTLHAQSSRQTMSVFRAGAFGCRAIGLNDTFVVRIMAGDAGQSAALIQGEYNAELFFHCLHAGQSLGRRFDQMIDITGVISSNNMTPLADHFKISNELDILITISIFIRLFGVTEKTFFYNNFPPWIQLGMGVKHYVISFIMAFKAEIRSF